MPIRVEHQIGAIGGLAGFASGYGLARQRQRKYMLDMYRDATLIRERRLDQQRQHQWQLDAQAADVVEAKRHEGVVAGLAETRHKWDVEDAERQRGWYDERERRTADRNAFRAEAAGITPIPEWVTDASTRAQLGRLASALQVMAEQFDLNDPELRRKFAETKAQYEAMISAVPKPSPAEQRNRDRTYYDPATGSFHDTMGPGRRPVDSSTSLADIQAEEQRERVQREQRQQQIRDARSKQMADLDEEYRRVKFGGGVEDPQQRDAYLEDLRTRRNRLQAEQHYENPESVEWARGQLRQQLQREPTPQEIYQYISRAVEAQNPPAKPAKPAPTPSAPSAPSSAEPTAQPTATPPAPNQGPPQTQQEFDAAWAAAPAGSIVIGLDGKPYRKR